MTEPAPRWLLAASGAAAAAAALGTSELAAGAFTRAPSLIVAIADVVVVETPGGVARWSIETLGTAQKPALVVGIIVLSLSIGAILGLVARHRFAVAAAGFVAFGVVGGWAGARDPLSGAGWAWMAATTSAAAGVLALWLPARPRRAVAWRAGTEG